MRDGGRAMRITVCGAGAIGGVTGAALARAGHDVLLVDVNEAHVAAMNAEGLVVELPDGSWSARVRAVTPAGLDGWLDLVLLAVKAQHTGDALDALASRLAPAGTVVSLQNGLNEELIAARVGPERTVGCLVNWAADWIAPGRIQHGGAGAFVLGELDGTPSARVKELAALLDAVTQARWTDNIWGYKWAKHVYGALLTATALVDAHVYEVVERSQPVQRMLVALVAEGMRVAEAGGVRLEAFDEFDPAWYRAAAAGDETAVARCMAAIARHYRAHTKTKTGIWRDLAVRKRKTEVHAHLGATLAKAGALGLAMPLTRRLDELIGDLEAGRRRMAWANLDELVAVHGEGDVMTRPYWHYQDPLEVTFHGLVSRELLMEHVRTIGGWERESGSPGEAQAFDYIERTLKQYGLDVERREIEAYISLPQEGRLILPDGTAVEGLTHAFSPSTDGLEGEVVDVGEGSAQDYARVRAAGKIALIDSLATPGKAWAAQQAGAIGQIFVNMDHLHNMIVTTIWGTPTPETAWRIPRTPCVSIRDEDARRLRALMHRAPTRVRLVTRVRTGWTPIPHLVGHLDGRVEDRFVLLSGHVDSWHYGAMDNSTANATMLEVARLLGRRRDVLRRGIRFAFWSGHSHGRYAGSAWYADHAWAELHRRCVLHLNVDSTGARGATDYSVFHATEEAQSFAEAVVRDVTGQTGGARRFSRAGDQSFWGAGVPSAFMSLSGIPKQDTELSRAMERLFGTAGFPWWWHTREDTVDKIDPDVLLLDTKVYVAAALRFLNAPIVPLEPARQARALLGTLEELQGAARGHFDLGPAAEAARRLVARTEVLTAALDRLTAASPTAEAIEAVNRTLVRLSRVLVPLAYTTGDPFTHDLALPVPPLAGLQPARDLAALGPGSDAFKFTVAALVRERNRAAHALGEAADFIDDLLSRKEIFP